MAALLPDRRGGGARPRRHGAGAAHRRARPDDLAAFPGGAGCSRNSSTAPRRSGPATTPHGRGGRERVARMILLVLAAFLWSSSMSASPAPGCGMPRFARLGETPLHHRLLGRLRGVDRAARAGLAGGGDGAALVRARLAAVDHRHPDAAGLPAVRLLAHRQHDGDGRRRVLARARAASSGSRATDALVLRHLVGVARAGQTGSARRLCSSAPSSSRRWRGCPRSTRSWPAGTARPGRTSPPPPRCCPSARFWPGGTGWSSRRSAGSRRSRGSSFGPGSCMRTGTIFGVPGADPGLRSTAGATQAPKVGLGDPRAGRGAPLRPLRRASGGLRRGAGRPYLPLAQGEQREDRIMQEASRPRTRSTRRAQRAARLVVSAPFQRHGHRADPAQRRDARAGDLGQHHGVLGAACCTRSTRRCCGSSRRSWRCGSTPSAAASSAIHGGSSTGCRRHLLGAGQRAARRAAGAARAPRAAPCLGRAVPAQRG